MATSLQWAIPRRRQRLVSPLDLPSPALVSCFAYFPPPLWKWILYAPPDAAQRRASGNGLLNRGIVAPSTHLYEEFPWMLHKWDHFPEASSFTTEEGTIVCMVA
jgi:hypothetical protein